MAMRACGWRPTAIVSVADDGGSSGRLRQELSVAPPGDLRRALSSLCPDPVHRRLLEHRFDGGTLTGHAVGNFVLVGSAAVLDDDMTAGLAMLADLFDVQGRVVPVSEHGLDIEATLADGSVVRGQRRLTATMGMQHLRLVPADAPANPAAVDAIKAADLVVIGPGSLFTSLIPPLLMPGIATALCATEATTVVVANIRQQPGETEGMGLQDHVDALFSHLPAQLGIDVLVCNDGPGDHAAPADHDRLDEDVSHPRVDRVVRAAMADDRGSHDAGRLAAVLRQL